MKYLIIDEYGNAYKASELKDFHDDGCYDIFDVETEQRMVAGNWEDIEEVTNEHN